jgi:chromosome partitioning protein
MLGVGMKSIVISVAQQKGGSGKTTIACHLAIGLSQRGYKVAAIDIDPQGSFAGWHNLREHKFGKGYTGLTFLTTSGWRSSSEINDLKRKHDFVIIDSPPHTDADTKSIIRQSDMVIIPMQPNPTDIWATEKTIKFVAKENVAYKIILNRVNNNSKLAKDLCSNIENIMDSKIGNRVHYASCMIDGRTVTESDPNSVAAQEIKNFLAEIEQNVLQPVDA